MTHSNDPDQAMAHGSETPITQALIGKLFIVSGRISGDDEDTLYMIEAPDHHQANQMFIEKMISNLSVEECEEEPEVFIIHSYPLPEAIGQRLAPTPDLQPATEGTYQPPTTFPMVDWRTLEGEPLEEAADDQTYTIEARLGNQPSLEFFDAKGESCFGLMIEINEGVPAVHVSSVDGASTLHIHAAQDGLVLTPEDKHTGFKQAEMDRHSYKDPRSLVIRPALVPVVDIDECPASQVNEVAKATQGI